MTVTWWTASGIILHHRSNAYELFTYCSSLVHFSVAIVIITIKHQKYYFCYHYLLPQLPLLSYYFASKHFAADIKFLGVVELTTQLLILENILWLPLCRINNFGLNTLPSKIVAIPYTCGLSVGAAKEAIRQAGIMMEQMKVVRGPLNPGLPQQFLTSPRSWGQNLGSVVFQVLHSDQQI